MDGIEATRRFREYEESQLRLQMQNDDKGSKNYAISIGETELLVPAATSGLTDSAKSATATPTDANAATTDATLCGKLFGKRGRLPIIGMSANSDAISRESALAVGMDLFLGKPYTIADLKNAIRTAVFCEE
jgi:CheY-like chemotaxis protein